MIHLSGPAFRLLFVAYLGLIYFAAFWPFDFVAVCFHQRIERTAGGVRTDRCAALSSPAPPAELAAALQKADGITVEVDLSTADIDQSGPARIFSYSQGASLRNFTLGQQEAALSFRLRTTGTDLNGIDPHLETPSVFRPGKRQHLVVTYGKGPQRLYVDGKIAAESELVSGGFSNWDEDHYLTVGNERTPNRPWRGVIYHAAVYARALSPGEAARNYRASRERGENANRVSQGLAAFYDFSRGRGEEPFADLSLAALGGPLDKAQFQSLQRTLLANLHLWFGMKDMIQNILAFLPIGFFLYRLGPTSLRKRPALFILAAFFIGLSISFSIEYFQQFTEKRSPNLLDLIYNGVGGGLGGLLAWLDARRERPWFVAPPPKGEAE
ncbi:MAG: LamG-like jellyroll fold domain-containing protein [Desulfococcaceae bacterium]